MANAFAPSDVSGREKQVLRSMLLQPDGTTLGALPEIWGLQARFGDEYQEEDLHKQLAEKHVRYRSLLSAIQAYEAFIRGLQDSFDLLLAEGARSDSCGYELARISSDREFVESAKDLNLRFKAAHKAFSGLDHDGAGIRSQFEVRFAPFAQPLRPTEVAKVLCDHHETIQRGKSADGKRPWFDRVGPDRIHVRQQFRKRRRPIEPGRYVGYYRGRPIRRFYFDLS
jgi:hypothetical protein